MSTAPGKSRIAILAILGAALVGLSAWLFWDAFGAGTGPTSPRPATSRERHDSRAPAEPGKEPERVVTQPFGKGDAEGVPSPRGFLVRAVLAETGTALPEAEIRFIDTSYLQDWEHFWKAALHGGADRWLWEQGKLFITDERGEARVPHFWRSAVVVATKGQLRSECHWPQRAVPDDPESQLVLELTPKEAFDVRVVDDAGSVVAGVPVGVMHKTATKRHLSDVVRTGRDGMVRFFRSPGGGGSVAPAQRWLAAGIPAINPPAIPYPEGALPDGPLDLALPPCGELVVYINGPGGQPYRGTAWVDVIVEQRPGSVSDLLGAHSMTQFTKAGVVRFTHVAAGQHFRLTARDAGDLHALVEHSVEGPTAAGAEKSVTITLGSMRPVIAGRLLHADGSPVASSQVIWEARTPTKHGSIGDFDVPGVEASPFSPAAGAFYNEGEGSREYVMTDEAGDFRIPVDQWLAEHEDFVLRFVVWSSERESDGIEGPGITVPLKKVGPGLNDLGDLQVLEPEVIVTGQVIDDLGRPVPRASMELWGPAPQLTGPTPVRPAGPDGRFRLRSHDTIGGFSVRAWKPGHVYVWPKEFQVGQQGVVFTLPRTGVVAGKLLFDPAVPPTVIAMVVWQRTAAGDEFSSACFSPEVDGRFCISDLSVGTSELRVSLATGEDPPLVTLAGLAVQAGKTVRDPRLVSIDVRGMIAVAVLTFVDQQGKAIACLPEVQAVSAEGSDVKAFRDPGRVTFAGEIPDVIRVRVPGYDEYVQGAPFATQRIVLTRSRPFGVSLQLPDMDLLQDRELRVRVGLERSTPAFDVHRTGFLFQGPLALVDRTGGCRLQVPGPGTYFLRLEARHYREAAGTWSSAREFYAEPDVTIDLRKDPGNEVVPILLDTDELRRFLLKLPE